MRDVKGPGFVRFLYNQNPFYLISAAVILYGFRMAMQETSFASNPWILAILFAGYTTLLALTAWLIVRFGRVWDDARSIFMVLLLLFMALSASLDGMFVNDPTTAIALAVAGFSFAVIICESLVWSLGIRFRALFRGPLYSMFAISFFYPYMFSIQKTMWPQIDHRFIILLFPFVVSATILSLIPAIRKTKLYACKNGTPWNWPLYPYSLFFLAIVGLIGRTIMMGLSFDASVANGMLGTWMFAPIYMSLIWLVYEIGSVEGDRKVQFTAMMLMPLSIALAIPWSCFPNTDFYEQVANEVGSPVWMAMLSVVVMYFMAWIDKVELAGFFLAIGLLGAATINQDGSVATNFTAIEGWPLLVLATCSLASWDRIARSSCWFLAACFASVPLGNRLGPLLADTFEPLQAIDGIEAAVAANLLLVFSCLLVCVFSGTFAKQLKVCLAIIFPAITALSAVGTIIRPEHAATVAVYGCVLASLGFFIFVFARSRLHLSASAISFGVSLMATIPLLEYSINADQFRFAGFIGAGLACFVIGLLVSATKAGWTRKFNSGIGKLKQEISEAFPSNPNVAVTERSLG